VAATGRFCVNVLAHDQEALCRRFAAPGDRFAGHPWTLSPGGSPVLGGAVSWIDCSIGTVTETGDHVLVLGAVEAMEVCHGAPRPLVFLGGAYGGFAAAPA
jgi:flavin reductase (DIM6/NTAB) family NADH-FMN oxidoreductase RutF